MTPRLKVKVKGLAYSVFGFGIGLLRRFFGFRVKWLSRVLIQFDRSAESFGLDGLDLKLTASINTAPSYYIEIGANDGVSQSNTLLLELLHGWHGLLIEPVPSTFQRLKRNRSSRRNFLLRAACKSEETSAQVVDLLYSNLMTVSLGMDSDIADPAAHAMKGQKYLGPEDVVHQESAPAVTLTQALNLAGAPREIGLLSLDVEGVELEVLRGLDFGTYNVEWILVEVRDLPRVRDYLSAFGFTLQAKLSHHDYLFSGDLSRHAGFPRSH